MHDFKEKSDGLPAILVPLGLIITGLLGGLLGLGIVKLVGFLI